MRKVEYFCLSIIIFLSVITRLYRIDNPVADWHSWRQADTAAVTRNFVKEGINLLYPRYDDLSNIASGRDNPQGWRFVEFPLYNAAAAVSYNIFPNFSIEKWGRLVSVGLAVLSLIFIYFLTRKYLGAVAALFSAGIFALLPYNIFYGRVILPEPALVCFSTGMLWFFSVLITERKKWGMLFLLFGAGAMLIKPVAAFLFLPMVYLIFREIREIGEIR
ncbi:MAG: glycosyltransferase family 39 protein, partial [bacterium]|nr:glycosyltransferase family 39 protein [bacterium]